MVTIIKPNTALARLTSDSIASDSKPTESVSHQARVFRPIVISATKTEAHSMRVGVIQASNFFMSSAYPAPMNGA